MAFKVRQLTQQDIPTVAAIEAATFPHPFTIADFTATLATPTKNCFVVETYEDVIGAVQANVSAYCYVSEIDETRVEIMTLAVGERYRREGQAKFLLEMVLRYLQATKMTEVTLEVRPSNQPALNLYTSFGFEHVAVRKNYYQDPQEDAYLLQKTFV